LLAEDVVVCFERLQIIVDDKEKSSITTYHVLNGINCYCVGFLIHISTRFSALYEDVLAQIRSVCPGSSVAVIISCLPEEKIKQMTINSVDDTNIEYLR